MTYDEEVLADSPLVYAKLDGGTITQALTDFSGNERHGTGEGSAGPTYGVAGLIPSDAAGTAVRLYGNGQRLYWSPAAWMNSASISVEAWFSATTVGISSMNIACRDRGSERIWRLDVSSDFGGVLSFSYWTTTGGPYFIRASTKLSAGRTYHAVATYDAASGDVALYLDGVRENVSDAVSPTIPGAPLRSGSTYPMYIGSAFNGTTNTPGTSFDGVLDGFSLYPGTLSALRCAAHYGAGSGHLVLPEPAVAQILVASPPARRGLPRAPASSIEVGSPATEMRIGGSVPMVTAVADVHVAVPAAELNLSPRSAVMQGALGAVGSTSGTMQARSPVLPPGDGSADAQVGVEVQVWDRTGEEMLAVLDRRKDVAWQDDLNETGTGGFSLHRDDPKATGAILAPLNIVKVLYGGEARYAFRIEERRLDVAVTGDYEEQWWKVSGRGVLSMLSDAVLYPEYGINQFTRDERGFSFASKEGPWYVASEWSPPQALPIRAVPADHPWKGHPADWPDPDAAWIWATDPAQQAGGGTAWFRSRFTMTESATITVYVSGDDQVTLYLDGYPVAATVAGELYAFRKTSSFSVRVLPGEHLLAAEVVNTLEQIPEVQPIITNSTIAPAYATDSNRPYIGAGLSDGGNPYVNPDGSVDGGGTGAAAFDGDDGTYWMSVGNYLGWSSAYEYVEGTFDRTMVTAVRIKLRGGPYNVYVSLKDGGSNWNGESTIPYRKRYIDSGAAVRYVTMVRAAPDQDLTLNIPPQTADRIRVTLKAEWNSGIWNYKWRAAIYTVAVTGESREGTYIRGGNFAGLLATVATTDESGAITGIVHRSRSDGWLCKTGSRPGWRPSHIMSAILNEAKDRGVLGASQITLGFTDDMDSYGAPWDLPRKDVSYSTGSDYLSIARRLVEDSDMDIWLDPGTLVLNAAPRRGIDSARIDSAVVLRPGHSLSDFSVETGRPQGTRMIAESDYGWVEIGDFESELSTGRIEGFASLGNAMSLEESRQQAYQALERFSAATHDVSLSAVDLSGPLPYFDYGIGDLILAPGDDGESLSRYRILSLGIREDDAAGIEVNAELDLDTWSPPEVVPPGGGLEGGTPGAGGGGGGGGGSTPPGDRETLSPPYTSTIVLNEGWESGSPGEGWHIEDSTYGSDGNRLQRFIPANVQVSPATTGGTGNSLKLYSKREVFDGYQFTAGMLSTRATGAYFPRYGRYAMRARLPHGHGVWPAFWLRHRDGATICEPDIMEYFIGQNPGKVSCALHRTDAGGNFSTNVLGGNGILEQPTVVDASRGWHTFSMDIIPWTASTVSGGTYASATTASQYVRFVVYVDDRLMMDKVDTSASLWTARYADEAFDICLQGSQIGGDWAGHPDDPLGYSRWRSSCLSGGTPPDACRVTVDGLTNVKAVFPNYMEVDWVRVWRYSGPPPKDDFGVPDDIALTLLTSANLPYPADRLDAGTLTINTDSAVYDGWRIPYRVVVDARNVIIRNCLLPGLPDVPADQALINVRTGGTASATIERCTIQQQKGFDRVDGVRGSNFTVKWCAISGTTDGVHIFGSTTDRDDPAAGNVTISNTRIRDLVVYPDPNQPDGYTHNDGIQIVGGKNISITDNLFEGAMRNAALQVTQKVNPVAGLTFSRNRVFSTGGSGVNIYDGAGDPIPGVTIRGNVSKRGAQTYPFIVSAGTVDEGLAFSGNTWSDSSQPPPTVKRGSPSRPGSTASTLSWDWDSSTKPCWKYTSDQDWLSRLPIGSTPIVPIRTGGPDFYSNLKATVDAAGRRVIVSLDAGVYELSSFRMIGNSGDPKYSFGFWHPNLAGLIGQGPDKTFVQMRANSMSPELLTAIQQMQYAEAGNWKVLEAGVIRIDGSSTSPVCIGGITFRSADQQDITDLDPSFDAAGVRVPQPAPHAGLMIYPRSTAYLSHVRFRAFGRAVTSAPPFECAQINSQLGRITLHRVEIDGRRDPVFDPARTKRGAVYLMNDEYSCNIEYSHLHSSNVSRYAVNDENHNTRGLYRFHRSKIEQITTNANYGLGGEGGGSCMGFESTAATIELSQSIICLDNPRGGTRPPVHVEFTKTGDKVRTGGKLTVTGCVYRSSAEPDFEGWLLVRATRPTQWFSEGVTNRMDVRHPVTGAAMAPYIHYGNWPPSLESMLNSGATSDTHYIVQVP